MNPTQLFRSYELLVDKADQAFQEMQQKYGECIRCELHCSDCCHAVFGLFLIEAAYLKQNFDQLGKEKIKTAFLRCNEADRAQRRLEKMLKAHVCRATEDLPPKIHNLVRLAELTGLSFSKTQQEFLSEFDMHQLEGRYPDRLPRSLTKSKAKQELHAARKVLQWLSKQF